MQINRWLTSMGQSHFSIPFDLTSFHRRGSTRGLCYLTFTLTVHATVEIDPRRKFDVDVRRFYEITSEHLGYFMVSKLELWTEAIFEVLVGVFRNTLKMSEEKFVCWRDVRIDKIHDWNEVDLNRIDRYQRTYSWMPKLN